MSGPGAAVCELFTAAKTRPLPSACRLLRLMWSSASLGPWIAVRLPSHVVVASPSTCTAKYIAESTWLLHMTPILPGPSATPDEISSDDSVVDPLTAGVNGAPHWVSLPVVRAM